MVNCSCVLCQYGGLTAYMVGMELASQHPEKVAHILNTASGRVQSTSRRSGGRPAELPRRCVLNRAFSDVSLLGGRAKMFL